MSRRRASRLVVLLTIAGAVVLVGTFLPWLYSGTRSRSSYELLGLVDRLELAHGLGGDLIRWWPLAPLVVTATVVLAWWGGRWSVLALALVTATFVVTVTVLLRRGAERARLRVGFGPTMTVVGAVALVVGSVWLVWSGRARPAPSDADSVPSPHAHTR